MQYLEEKYREYSDGCVHAEGAEGRHLRGGPDPEGHEVRERGDGDGHARVLHRPPEPLRHAPRAELLLAQRVPTLDDDEHVVNPNPEHEEGDDGVGWGVPEPYGRADAVTDDDAHDDPKDAAKTEEESLLDKVESTDHDDDVDDIRYVRYHYQFCLNIAFWNKYKTCRNDA